MELSGALWEGLLTTWREPCGSECRPRDGMHTCAEPSPARKGLARGRQLVRILTWTETGTREITRIRQDTPPRIGKHKFVFNLNPERESLFAQNEAKAKGRVRHLV